MKTIKLRPIDCRTVPANLEPLPEGKRDQLVSLFRALGDPTRLEIFRLIAAQADPICVCDVVDRFDVSQPTISHHLKVLREAGLVTVSRRGIWAYYAPDPAGLKQFGQLSGSLKLEVMAAVG
jgi:ArsR family transcriptional regulator